MTGLLLPHGTDPDQLHAATEAAIDRLAGLVANLTPDQLRAFAARLQPEDLDLLEVALARAHAQGWRATPATMAAELEPGRWRTHWQYVQLLAAKFVEACSGASNRQIWMLPARYGKTTWGSVWGPVWALDATPWLDVILTSYGHELAVENAVAVRDIAEANADRLRVQLRRDRRKAARWNTTEGGGLMAAGVGGRMTGFGGDVVVVDDPFKNWEEAHSKVQRDKVWNWYRSVVRLRLNSDSSSIVVVGTRWHEDDLVGRLLNPPDGEDAEQWEVVRIPAIAEDPADTEGDSKWWQALPDPLGRAPGDVLEPERFGPIEVHTRARVLGSYLAASMEQQRPAPPEGTIVKRAWWKFYRALPDPTELTDWMTSWDMAFKDTSSGSYVVGQVWVRWKAHRFLIDQVRDRLSFTDTVRAVQSLTAKYPKAGRHLIEEKANGAAVIDALRAEVPGLVPLNPTDSKEARLHACTGVIEAGNVWLPDPAWNPEVHLPPDVLDHHGIDREGAADRRWVHDYIEELCGFPHYPNDDQVDATTQALLEYAGLGVVEQAVRDTTSALAGRR